MYLPKTRCVIVHKETSFIEKSTQHNLMVCGIRQHGTHLLLRPTAKLVRNLSYASAVTFFLREKCKSSKMDVTLLGKYG